VDGTGSTVLTVRTGPLPPGTAVALRTEADTPPPGRDLVPWPVAWDGVLGSSLPTAAGIAVLGPLAFLIGRRWSTSAGEDPPEPALTVTPPEGLGPVQTAFVVDEAVPPHGLVATLLHQAERELVRLREQDDGTWSVEGLGGDWTAVDPVTAAVGTRLGVAREGGSFEADGSIEAGRALASARDAIGPATRAWALEAGVLVRARAETRARLAVAAAAVAFLGLAVTAPGGMTLWALPFGTLALGGAGLVRGGVGLRRTERGRALWSQAEGLRRMMCAPPGGDQLDLSAGRDLYPASIPYAVAFGCAEGWAQKYRMSTGEPPPEPRWVPVPRLAAVPGPAVALASVQSFEASLTATIGSYQASQISSTGAGSSSSGSGGGGSGGGGGGGSW
jgi:uncharacterized membrane protein YgcG